MRWLREILSRMATKSDSPVIATNDQGISLVSADGRTLNEARWVDVDEVMAYKRDLVTRDLFCLEIRSVAGGVLALHEEMPGWTEGLAALPKHLPGSMSPHASFMALVQPAFAINETIVYQKEPHSHRP
jgi:hypothetical protein